MWPERLTRDSLPYNHGMQSRMSLPRGCRLAAFLLMLWVSLGASAQTPGAGPVLIVTYVEAPPAKGAALAADLHAYAGQIENGPGKPRVTVLREFGRPNRMVIIEQWPDSSSPAFAKSETELAAMVQPDVRAPMDRRVNHPLTPALTQMASAAFVVLMHVDMSLAGPAALKVLQAQRDSVLAAPDALGYEDAVQDQHENHFAVCEVWKSRTAYEAYTATGPAEDFRRQLAALLGSPFDDRFYERVGH
jgi:quinol monooxygenase YgiN